VEPRLLFVVEDAFQITGRGCVLAPGPVAEAGGPVLRVGDRIRLVKPDGQSIETTVRGIEMIGRRPRPAVITAPILLPREITKDQVPPGTHVFALAHLPAA
jgi:translation elongation factor EF-Tu-like GTPase